MFRRGFCFAILSVFLLSWSVSASCAGAQGSTPQTSATDEVNVGVSAYQAGHYDEAIRHFRSALQIEPGLLLAKTYLGTALAQDVEPGNTTPGNVKIADEAIGLFNQALAIDPHDANSIKNVGVLYFNTQRLDDARTWMKKAIAEDAQDADSAYTIGVIDWTEAQANALKALQTAGIQDDGMGNAAAPSDLLAGLAKQNGPLVDEALKYLNQAVTIRADYDDAMTYLNLVYRRKADVDFDKPTVRDEDIAKATEWQQKAVDTRKAAEQKGSSATPAQH